MRTRAALLFIVICVAIVAGCTRMRPVEKTTLRFETLADLQTYLRQNKGDLELFRLRGPFGVSEHTDHELTLSGNQHVVGDLYLSSAKDKAPLVIFLHGYEVSKEAHGNQAMHVASWGMHAFTVQLSKRGPWEANGRTLARIARHIRQMPAALNDRVDPNKIILVGHSFGASAVAVALAEGAPVMGGVLLDPAAIGRNLPTYLRKISTPVLVLGADEHVSPTRNRQFFFDYIRTRIAEVSIKDATHEDAQYPSQTALQNGGLDSETTEDLQLMFVSALTSAALSLSATGAFDEAWASYGGALQAGKLLNAKRK